MNKQPDPWLRLCEEVGTTEAVYTADLVEQSRGEFRIKERNGRLYALIGRRWCSVVRRENGKLVEVWTR